MGMPRGVPPTREPETSARPSDGTGPWQSGQGPCSTRARESRGDRVEGLAQLLQPLAADLVSPLGLYPRADRADRLASTPPAWCQADGLDPGVLAVPYSVVVAA